VFDIQWNRHNNRKTQFCFSRTLQRYGNLKSLCFCSSNYAYTISTHMSLSFISFALQKCTETLHAASLLRAAHPRFGSW
jgi:hypothetical protein